MAGRIEGTVGWFRETANNLDSDILAISELIKNCYDADANTVQINLEKAFVTIGQNPYFFIKDDGHGMSMEDVNLKWFRIGDSINTRERYSPKGRVRQGGKGIGRLGAWKIGEKVTLYSSKKGSEPIGISIDISELPSSASLDEIDFDEVPGAREYFPRGEYGTLILVEKFNEKLTGELQFCQNMNRNILLLQNPFQGLDDFQIIPHYPPETIQSLQEFNLKSLTNNALYHADITIRGNQIEGKLSNHNIYCDNYETVEEISEIIDSEDKIKLKDVKVKIRAYGNDKMYDFTRVLPGAKQQISKEKFQQVTGFRLYKNGIRVMPYGKKGNDWLSLDKDHAKRADSIFRSSQIIAMANYNSELNPLLKEVASRNGLNINSTYKFLVECLNTVTRRLRKFAGKIPREIPTRFTAPKLHYSLVRIEQNTNFTSGHPVNSGGPVEKYSITKSLGFTNLQIDGRSGIIDGNSPDKVGQYNIQVIAKNEHGSTENILLIEVFEPKKVDEDLEKSKNDVQKNESDDTENIVQPIITVNNKDQNKIKIRNELSSSISSLNIVVNKLEDEAKVSEVKAIIEKINDLISELE
jgi:hypothetical protein